MLRRVFDRTAKPLFLTLRSLLSRVLERHYGIETARNVDLETLGLEGEQRQGYKPSEWSLLPRILPKREVKESDVFIDFGSGQGRVVYQAAHYPFRRVIGVELSGELNDVARRNVHRNRHRLRCPDIQLVTTDVLDYEIPDDVTVAFFANPFQGHIFATVVERLLTSVDRKPRRLRIIYRNPVEHAFLMSTGRIRPLRQLRGLRPSREWSRSNSTRSYLVTPAISEQDR